MLPRDFFTAGSAIFTVTPADNWLRVRELVGDTYHTHYTYRIERVEFDDGREMFFVKSLTGRDNTSDYTYLGCFNPQTGAVYLTRKSAFPATATRVVIVQRVMKAIWENRGHQIEAAGWTVRHIGKCGRCSRPLTTALSLDRGIGPDCWEQMGCGQPQEEAVAF